MFLFKLHQHLSALFSGARVLPLGSLATQGCAVQCGASIDQSIWNHFKKLYYSNSGSPETEH